MKQVSTDQVMISVNQVRLTLVDIIKNYGDTAMSEIGKWNSIDASIVFELDAANGKDSIRISVRTDNQRISSDEVFKSMPQLNEKLHTAHQWMKATFPRCSFPIETRLSVIDLVRFENYDIDKALQFRIMSIAGSGVFETYQPNEDLTHTRDKLNRLHAVDEIHRDVVDEAYMSGKQRYTHIMPAEDEDDDDLTIFTSAYDIREAVAIVLADSYAFSPEEMQKIISGEEDIPAEFYGRYQFPLLSEEAGHNVFRQEVIPGMRL